MNNYLSDLQLLQSNRYSIFNSFWVTSICHVKLFKINISLWEYQIRFYQLYINVDTKIFIVCRNISSVYSHLCAINILQFLRQIERMEVLKYDLESVVITGGISEFLELFLVLLLYLYFIVCLIDNFIISFLDFPYCEITVKLSIVVIYLFYTLVIAD